MFCKYCGASIEGDSQICPACSRKGGRVDSGVGFWDMFTEPETPAFPSAPDKDGRMDSFEQRLSNLEQMPATVLKKSSPLPFLLCMILCIALCAASYLLISRSADGKIMNLESKLLQLQDRLSAAEARLEGAQEPEQQSAEITLPEPVEEALPPIQVVNVPGDERQSIGYKSQPGFYLFRFIIEGPVKSFVWEKQQPDGSWQALEFDESGFCKRMGLRLSEDINASSSYLAADGLTLESAGVYRCLVTGTEGQQLTAVVNLSLGDEEPDEASSGDGAL